MQTEILLEGMEFHAFHGVYPEEKMLGNRFRVDVLMKLDVPFQPENQDLSRTIDYSLVYAILKDKMENATPLLESLGQGICRELAASFPLLMRTRDRHRGGRLLLCHFAQVQVERMGLAALHPIQRLLCDSVHRLPVRGGGEDQVGFQFTFVLSLSSIGRRSVSQAVR